MLLSFLFLHRVLELDRGILEFVSYILHVLYIYFCDDMAIFDHVVGFLFVFPFALLCSVQE